MRIRNSTPLDSFETSALVTNRHPRSAFGKAVLVLEGDGVAVGPREAEFCGFEVVEATEEERKRLLEAGYHLPGLGIGSCDHALR